MNSIFLEQSIPELLKSIEQKRLSFEDFANTTASIIEKKEASTLAWVTYDLKQLKSDAKKAYERYKSRGSLLELDGIPFGVKDIFNTKSFPTQMGSEIWKNFNPGNNARAVDSLLSGGGILAGKTVTAEFAVHALNKTLNPHDPSKTPGTSSSGSAAAVATGMVPYTLGTQTAGSIIRPASFCGVWGMKPSFGLIPRTGALKTTDTLDSIGFLAAHGKSLRVILDQLRVKGPDYPYVYNNVDKKGSFPKQSKHPWRVGFVKTHVWDKATKYAKQSVTELASKIDNENGFEVEEISWPEELDSSHDVHQKIYNKCLSYYFQSETRYVSKITPVMNKLISKGKEISDEEFKMALQAQEIISAKLDELFTPYDIVLSLSTSSSAPPRGTRELADPSLIWTMGHLPTISVPIFRCMSDLPFGAQFTSTKRNDYVLLQGVEEMIDRNLLPTGSTQIK